MANGLQLTPDLTQSLTPSGLARLGQISPSAEPQPLPVPAPKQPSVLDAVMNVPGVPSQTRGDLAMHEAIVGPTREKLFAAQTAKGKFESLKEEDEARRKARLESRKADLTSEYVRSIREAPETQQLDAAIKEAENSAFIPTQENSQDLAQLFGLISVIGFAIGVGGKGHAIQAMNAMNGMLEGHRLGREDLYKREKQVFDTNMKALKTKIDAIRAKREDAMKLLALDHEAGMQKLASVYAEEGADFLKKNAELRGEGANVELLKGLLTQVEHAANISQKETDRARERAAKFEDEKRLADIRHQNRLIEIEASAKFRGRRDRTDIGLINEIRDAYPDIDEEDMGYIPPKVQEQLKGSMNSSRNIERIADYVAKHPQAVGALAAAAAKLNINAIDSLDTYEVQMSRIPMSEEATVLNKMLTTQAYADVQATGQRPTVYLDRVFKGLYSQAVTPETLLSILKERQHEADAILNPYGLGIKKRSDVDKNFPLYNRDARTYLKDFGNAPTSGTQKTTLNGREIIVRNGKWVYKDTGEEAK